MRSGQRMMRELAPGRTRPALPEEPRGGPAYGRGRARKRGPILEVDL